MGTAGRELRTPSVEASGLLVSWTEVGCSPEPFGVDGVVCSILNKVLQGLVDSGLQLLVFEAHGDTIQLCQVLTSYRGGTEDLQCRMRTGRSNAHRGVVYHGVDPAIVEVLGGKLDVGGRVDRHDGDQLVRRLSCRG